MKDKVKVGLVLTLGLIFCLVIQYFSTYLFDIIVFGLAFLAVKEFKKLQTKSGLPSFDYCPEIACFLIFVIAFTGFLCGLDALPILLIEIAFVAIFYLVLFLGSFLVYKKELQGDKFRDVANMSEKRFAFFKANNTLTCILYPTLLLFFMYFINHISELGLTNFNENTKGAPMGLFGLILTFAICCLSDTFAMLFGILIKGKKLFPKISPNKTLSGCLFGLVGGIFGAIVTFVVFSLIFPTAFSTVSLWKFAIVGLFGSVLAQGGDLFESYLKRKAKVKDAGDFFRSHGGVLDRLDSVIFATPYIFICLLFLFG